MPGERVAEVIAGILAATVLVVDQSPFRLTRVYRHPQGR
jgi:hypothetical protein